MLTRFVGTLSVETLAALDRALDLGRDLGRINFVIGPSRRNTAGDAYVEICRITPNLAPQSACGLRALSPAILIQSRTIPGARSLLSSSRNGCWNDYNAVKRSSGALPARGPLNLKLFAPVVYRCQKMRYSATSIDRVTANLSPRASTRHCPQSTRHDFHEPTRPFTKIEGTNPIPRKSSPPTPTKPPPIPLDWTAMAC